jgi:hypothetical protein
LHGLGINVTLILIDSLSVNSDIADQWIAKTQNGAQLANLQFFP